MVLMVLSLFHRCSFHSLPFDVRPLIQTHKTCSSLFRSVHFYCLHLCACACVCVCVAFCRGSQLSIFLTNSLFTFHFHFYSHFSSFLMPGSRIVLCFVAMHSKMGWIESIRIQLFQYIFMLCDLQWNWQKAPSDIYGNPLRFNVHSK